MLILSSGSDASLKGATTLNKNTVLLEKSLNRLSSGQKIASSADDAGGLAVGMKLAARITDIEATKTNIQNALSFVQVQDGALKNLAAVVTRIDELRVMCDDVTKSPTDIQNYQTEYAELRDEMLRLAKQDFNGIQLFGIGAIDPLTVYLSENGNQTMQISRPVLFDILLLEHKVPASSPFAKAPHFFPVGYSGPDGKMISDGDGTMDLLHDTEFLTDLSRQALTEQLVLVSTMLATKGAESSRLQFALDSQSVTGVNIEAAHSRIMDVDVARESSNLVRMKILQEAGTASLQKANEALKYILPLLNPTSQG